MTQKSLAEAQRVNHLLSSELDSLKTYIKYLQKDQEESISSEISRIEKFKQTKLDKEIENLKYFYTGILFFNLAQIQYLELQIHNHQCSVSNEIAQNV